MSKIRAVPLAVTALLLASSAGLAQNRSDLVDQARAQLVGSPTALNRLLEATNPLSSPLDSMWAVGVYDMADNLINVGESALAAVWLRWAARHGSEWPIDRTWYSPVVVDAYDIAAPAVQNDGGLGEGGVSTTWRWPGTFDSGSGGTLEIDPGAPAGATVTVQGVGPVGPGGVMALPPTTYQITASAPGYDDVSVSREILPGVATIVSFNLPPQLASNVQASVAASLALVSFNSGGQLVCTNGVVVNDDGLVVTAFGPVATATGIQVSTPRGTFTGYEVRATDQGRGVVVLGSASQPDIGPLLDHATGVTEGQYAWSIYQSGCANPTQARTLLTGWPANPTGSVGLTQLLPATTAGAPLVDETGAWVGLVLDEGTVLPSRLAESSATGVFAGNQPPPPAQVGPGGGGGGAPWGWIAAGVGAAGVAAAVLLGGGGDPGPPAPTTGAITIRFPPIGRP